VEIHYDERRADVNSLLAFMRLMYNFSLFFIVVLNDENAVCHEYRELGVQERCFSISYIISAQHH